MLGPSQAETSVDAHGCVGLIGYRAVHDLAQVVVEGDQSPTVRGTRSPYREDTHAPAALKL